MTGTLGWIVASGLVMSLLALSGSLTLVLPRRWFDRVVRPLVALAAGSLLGGALFVMVPGAVAQLGDGLSVYVALAAGVVAFLLLEQFLHWHHCHLAVCAHAPVGVLVLVADAVHNLIGGLAVGSAFVVDIRLGVVTWLVAAAHEVPQELGDFGILVHSGWSRRSALAYNVLSALTFLLGGLIAYAASAHVDVALLVPFAAGSFIYIALADLVPQITDRPSLVEKVTQTASFLAGLGLLLATAILAATSAAGNGLDPATRASRTPSREPNPLAHGSAAMRAAAGATSGSPKQAESQACSTEELAMLEKQTYYGDLDGLPAGTQVGGLGCG